MFRFEYKAYRRSFAKTFSNAREQFAQREGILLRVEDKDGRFGFGEAAPIPSFGTESFPSALSAAVAIGEGFEANDLLPKLRDYRALKWGIESAIEALESEDELPELGAPWPVCSLIGDLQDLAKVEQAVQLGYRCLKFKIGLKNVVEEQRMLDRVIELTGGELQIRLDANASLSARSAAEWLESAADMPVEFIEQPFAVGKENEMLKLAGDYPTPLALDESVCCVDDLKRWRDAQWPGVFVVKPSLSGSRRALREELSMGLCDVVFSSALETKIGGSSAISFAMGVNAPRRALGFGTGHLFSDSEFAFNIGPFLQSDSLPSNDMLQTLWNQI